MAIKNKILGKGTLNDNDNKLPPMGVKIKGVSAAIPLIPNFCQIPTAYRARLENTKGFDFLKLPIQATRNFPTETIINTVSMKPTQEASRVSYHVSPKLNPAIGPAIYFKAVPNITATYFPHSISFSIDRYAYLRLKSLQNGLRWGQKPQVLPWVRRRSVGPTIHNVAGHWN